MKIFLLTKIINNTTDETFVRLFNSEEALQAHVAQNYPPRIKDIILAPSPELYRLRVRTLRTEDSPILAVHDTLVFEEDVDFADVYVTVPSHTDSSKVYSVAVNFDRGIGRIGQVLACSCPAFEFHPEQGSCKHMWDVMLNPQHYYEPRG